MQVEEVESGLDDYDLPPVKPRLSEIAGALELLECCNPYMITMDMTSGTLLLVS